MSISHRLRSYTAPLYSDLNSPPGTLYNIHTPRVWQRFLFSLDNRAVVIRPVPGLHISASARVIEVGSLRVRWKSDAPLLPNSDKPTWVRIADPAATEIVLTKSSKEALAWLLSCVQSTPTKPLSDPHLMLHVSSRRNGRKGDRGNRRVAVRHTGFRKSGPWPRLGRSGPSCTRTPNST